MQGLHFNFRGFLEITLLWRHNGRDSVSNHQPHDCLLNCLFRRRSKKTSKLRVTGLVTGDRWIPHTNGQSRGKCFHLMTSSCNSFIITMAIHNQQQRLYNYAAHINGLVQKRRNSIANALELRLSCTNPSIWYLKMDRLQPHLQTLTHKVTHTFKMNNHRKYIPTYYVHASCFVAFCCGFNRTLLPIIHQDSSTVAELFD